MSCPQVDGWCDTAKKRKSICENGTSTSAAAPAPDGAACDAARAVIVLSDGEDGNSSKQHTAKRQKGSERQKGTLPGGSKSLRSPMWPLNGQARTAPASSCQGDGLEVEAPGPEASVSHPTRATTIGESASSLHAALPPTPLQPQRLSTPGGVETAKQTPDCNVDFSQPAHDSFQAVCSEAAAQIAAGKAVAEDVRDSLQQRIQQEVLAANAAVAEVTPLLPVLASKDTSSFSKAQVNVLDWTLSCDKYARGLIIHFKVTLSYNFARALSLGGLVNAFAVFGRFLCTFALAGLTFVKRWRRGSKQWVLLKRRLQQQSWVLQSRWRA